MSGNSTFMEDVTVPATGRSAKENRNAASDETVLIAEDALVMQGLSDGLQRAENAVVPESSSAKGVKRELAASLSKDEKEPAVKKLKIEIEEKQEAESSSDNRKAIEEKIAKKIIIEEKLSLSQGAYEGPGRKSVATVKRPVTVGHSQTRSVSLALSQGAYKGPGRKSVATVKRPVTVSHSQTRSVSLALSQGANKRPGRKSVTVKRPVTVSRSQQRSVTLPMGKVAKKRPGRKSVTVKRPVTVSRSQQRSLTLPMGKVAKKRPGRKSVTVKRQVTVNRSQQTSVSLFSWLSFSTNTSESLTYKEVYRK